MRLFVRSRRLGSLKVLPGRTGTSEARVKKPSFAGGHWQRVGRAAFLCAGESRRAARAQRRDDALARLHAPAYNVPRAPSGRPSTRIAFGVSAHRTHSRSLIHGRPCHGFRSPALPALFALIQIRIVYSHDALRPVT